MNECHGQRVSICLLSGWEAWGLILCMRLIVFPFYCIQTEYCAYGTFFGASELIYTNGIILH